MSVSVMNAFFTLLSLLALAGAAGGVAVRLAGRRAAAVRHVLARRALPAAAAVATTAALGSLYYSELVGFVPCELCWSQRVFAYPLVLLLLVELARTAIRPSAATRSAVWVYALPLAGLGLAVSAWHIAVQRLPALQSGACAARAPCSAIYVEQFGFVTIPVMAATTFVFVLAAGLVAVGGRGGARSLSDRADDKETA